MHIETIELIPRAGVLVLSGYGVRIAVERGHLCLEDGVAPKRRGARFPRATRDLRRLVVLGQSGTVSLEALRWLADVGAAFAQIDSDGRVIAHAGPPARRDPKLRRAQALAHENGRGLEISRGLVSDKLRGQRAVLERLQAPSRAASAFERAAKRADGSRSIETLRASEAEAASIYWRSWAEQPVRFARQDAKKVPAHWRRFGRRASEITGNPRKATNPANAVLNYLYAILEFEARIAALAIGMDPALGVMHADLRSRDSLACDLMEPIRPVVDAWLLDLLKARAFKRSDFFETREGICRIMPPLTQLLAETAPRWAAADAPIAEGVAANLLKQCPKRKSRAARVATPLTETNRSTGRDHVRVRMRKGAHPTPAAAGRTCIVCGAELAKGRWRYCPDCRPDQSRDAAAKAHAALRAKREAGEDPAHGGEVGHKRGRRNAAVLRANAEWERKHGTANPEVFTTEILPQLAGVAPAEMARATGLSRNYCGLIRRGERVPHAQHWRALRELLSR